MKSKILFGVSLLLAAWQMQAQTNNLIIFDQQGEPFYAIVNGVRQNNTPQTNVKITGLTGNTLKATVIFKDSTIPAIDKTIYYQDNGTEETYNVIIKKDGEHVLRYYGVTPIPQAPPAPIQNQNVVSYNSNPPPSNSTTVVQQTTTTTTDGMPNGSVTMSVNGGNMGMNANGVQQTSVVTTTTTTSGSDIGGQQEAPPPPAQQSYVPGYNGPIGCPMPMSHDDYESAKSSISQKDFEDTKLSMAKQIAGANCLLAEQVRGIMKLFSFENSKLEFAKFAYTHTYDKGNYFKVNDAFDFDASSTELNNYISSH